VGMRVNIFLVGSGKKFVKNLVAAIWMRQKSSGWHRQG